MKNTILVNSLTASNGTRLSKTKDTSYPLVKLFTSTEHKISTPLQFHKLIQKTAKAGDCLIKGTLTRKLDNESRARSTDASLQTQWLVFDLDGANYPDPESFIQDLPAPFHSVSYTTQYSASAGIKPGLRCHIFFLLENPQFPVTLKVFFKHHNFAVPTLQNSLALTSTNVALLWPLDITVGQNDKIIYVAPPLDRVDKHIPKDWIVYTQKRKSRVDFSSIRFDGNETKISERKYINQLRKDQNLSPRRSIDTKKINGLDVMSKPGECIVTGHREERGFHYLNLNGGDSWAYYHKDGQNEILYNFKGEPLYLIRELLPDYYGSLSKAGSSGNDTPGTPTAREDDPTGYEPIRYLAFCDAKTDTYYRGSYDPSDNYLEIFKTNSLTKVKDYLKQHGQPVPDFIPEWDVIYDFDSDILVNDDDRTINLYQKTEYMKRTEVRTSIPTLIEKLLQHVLNYDQAVFNHFLNWLATIIQYRTQTGTAWVLHGTQGTGKGILFNSLLTPIIGNDYVFRTKLDSFEQEFNGYMEHSLAILVDETQISDLQRGSKAMAAIKQYISDKQVSIRRMRTDPYLVKNVSNFIFCSNTHDPIRIDPRDRRFNVASRQETPLLNNALTNQEIDELQSQENIQGFANYLMSLKVDRHKAAEVIHTTERARLQSLTQDAAEELVTSIQTGDLSFFVDNAPDSEDPETLKLKLRLRECRTYDAIVTEFAHNAHIGGVFNISRTDLEVLCYYIIGVEFPTRHKFSKYLGHKGMSIKAVNINNKTSRGIDNVYFKAHPEAEKRWAQRGKQKSNKRAKVVKIRSK